MAATGGVQSSRVASDLTFNLLQVRKCAAACDNQRDRGIRVWYKQHACASQLSAKQAAALC